MDLTLCILSSSSLFVIFKLFSKHGVQTFYAIVTNYFVAALCAGFFHNGPLHLGLIPSKPWFLPTLALGALFLVVFKLTAKTAQEIGVSVASVVSKMSLVVPVLLGVVLYRELLGPIKVVGILIALLAVYFVSLKEGEAKIKSVNLILPISLFLGSGLVDAAIKYLQAAYMAKGDFLLFSLTVFGAAGCTGFLLILFRSVGHPIKVNTKNLLAGTVLGIFNFFTLFFLLRALEGEILNSASIFTINNVATVLVSTLLGILLFKEKLRIKNWLGIVLAVSSILMVAFS
tara:strand:- start:22196 stop:23056 length:861 start_codon:yes stop_codon:yes gene_type:complete